MAASPERDPTKDPVAVPLASLILGFGPMLPIVLAGIGALRWTEPSRAVAIVGATGWAAAILIFISGVRRGYGFATHARPRVSTLLSTFGIFFAGLLAMPLFLLSPVLAICLLGAGFIAVGFADTLAARTGDAPRHFARLRPPQMAVGLLGLSLLGVACAR